VNAATKTHSKVSTALFTDDVSNAAWCSVLSKKRSTATHTPDVGADLLKAGQARVGSERRRQLLRPFIPNRVTGEAVWVDEHDQQPKITHTQK
jgi:hypothetical protein